MNKDFELMELLLDSLLVEQQTKLQLIRFLIVKLIKIHKWIGAKTAVSHQTCRNRSRLSAVHAVPEINNFVQTEYVRPSSLTHDPMSALLDHIQIQL